jgi:hypothetical protein
MINNSIVHGIENEVKKDLVKVWDEIKPKPIQRSDYKTDPDSSSSTSEQQENQQHHENPPPVLVDAPHTALLPPVDHLHEHDTLAIPIEKGFHSLQCPHSELMEFWKPVTVEDAAYKSPYAVENGETKYVIFEPGEHRDVIDNYRGYS